MISRLNRSTDTPAAISNGSTFTTMRRSSARSWATNTRDIPPPPSSRSMTNPVPSAACSWSRSSMLAALGVQPRKTLLDLRNLRLQLGVGVLPEIDERLVVVHRLGAVAFGFIQLAETARRGSVGRKRRHIPRGSSTAKVRASPARAGEELLEV